MNEPTVTCTTCFKSFKLKSLRYLFISKPYLCPTCYKQYEPKFIKHKINGIKAITLFEYDDNMRSLIYKFKGCYDIELSPIFLLNYAWYYRFVFFNYYLVPIPSEQEDDERRGFNHVKEIYKHLHLKTLDILYKEGEYKQSSHHAKDRYKIQEHLNIKDTSKIKGKNILIVDDVVTTGSTLRNAIKLIKKGSPRKIKIMTIAMTIRH